MEIRFYNLIRNNSYLINPYKEVFLVKENYKIIKKITLMSKRFKVVIRFLKKTPLSFTKIIKYSKINNKFFRISKVQLFKIR